MRITWKEATGQRHEQAVDRNAAGPFVRSLLQQRGDHHVDWVTVADHHITAEQLQLFSEQP